jgi:hypothetical protein
MSDRADKPSERRPIARLSELQTSQFISEALRAGRRAILVTGRGQASMRVPEAAVTACGAGSARALHIGPPLPEPPELQEIIGAAVGIAGGHEMTPQAMALLLQLADPRLTVILAIDEAHTLSRRSLCYLTLMTELLASEAPILQIVLAADPSLLDTLAEPEFEGLRSRLSRPLFEAIQTLRGKRTDGALLGLRKPNHGAAATRLARIQDGGLPTPSRRGRPAVRAAVGLVAVSGLAAIGYIAFATLIDPGLPPIPWISADTSQGLPVPPDPPQSLAQVGPGQSDETIDPLIDQTVDAAASGSVELTSTLLARIAKLESSGSPDKLKVMLTLEDRLAARMGAAAAAGRIDEARRLEQVFRLAYSANGTGDRLAASNQRLVDGAVPQTDIAEPPEFPPGGPPVSAQQLGAAADADPSTASPGAASSPAPPSAAPEQNVDAAPPTTLANSTPPDSPATPSQDQLGAGGNEDRTAVAPNPVMPAPPSAAPEKNFGEAKPAIVASAAPTTPDDPKTRVVADLPTLAPVRVVLNVARADAGRAADIQRALVTAGVQTDLVPVDARRPGPSIGYYFRSDRNAAATVSHLLAPLLGALDPVALQIREGIPEPGTIEIAIP